MYIPIHIIISVRRFLYVSIHTYIHRLDTQPDQIRIIRSRKVKDKYKKQTTTSRFDYWLNNYTQKIKRQTMTYNFTHLTFEQKEITTEININTRHFTPHF